MSNDDEDRRRDAGRSWTSWFQPADSRRLEEARNESTSNELDQHFERWVKAQDERARTKTRTNGHARAAEQGRRPIRDDFETNPFVAFKSFVDDQISAFTHLPAKSREQRRQQQEDGREAEATCEEEDKLRRWTGRRDVSHWLHKESKSIFADVAMCELSPEEHQCAEEATWMLLTESMQKNAMVPTAKLARLYFDPEPWFPARDLFSTFDLMNILESTNVRRPAWQETDILASRRLGVIMPWLSVDWFRHSPYSPMSLERHPELSKFDTKWRHAFENLLEATLDKPMTNEERFGLRSAHRHATSTWHGPGLDWMLSLQCRGILPPQLPSWYSAEHLHTASTGLPWQDFTYRFSKLERKPFGLHHDRDTSSLMSNIALPPPDGAQTADASTELDMYEQVASQSPVCPFKAGKTVQEGTRRERLGLCQDPEATGLCPDDLGREIQARASEEGAVSDDSAISYQALTNHQLQLMMVEEQNAKEAKMFEEQYGKQALEQEAYGRDTWPGECPNELGKEVQRAAEEEREQCPDPMGREIGAFARQLGCSVGELLDELEELEDDDELDDEDEDDEDDHLPGELWSQARQAQAAEPRRRIPLSLNRPWNSEAGIEEASPRPAHEGLARHWDRMVDQSREPYANQQPVVQQDAAGEKPVSTSMTTLTTRSADGSVTTKIVRQVRYADGREENSESVQTSEGEQTVGQDKPKKGWFWS